VGEQWNTHSGFAAQVAVETATCATRRATESKNKVLNMFVVKQGAQVDG
jgi:hypothetical protein